MIYIGMTHRMSVFICPSLKPVWSNFWDDWGTPFDRLCIYRVSVIPNIFYFIIPEQDISSPIFSVCIDLENLTWFWLDAEFNIRLLMSMIHFQI